LRRIQDCYATSSIKSIVAKIRDLPDFVSPELLPYVRKPYFLEQIGVIRRDVITQHRLLMRFALPRLRNQLQSLHYIFLLFIIILQRLNQHTMATKGISLLFLAGLMTGLAVIAGVGPGLGASLSSRFAKEYKVVLLARSQGTLDKVSQSITEAGGEVSPHQ
jgi:hypothetical protein